MTLLSTLPDNARRLTGKSFDIQDIKGMKEKYLLISNNSGSFVRNISGLWVLDVTTREMYVLVSDKIGQYTANYGGILNSSDLGRLYVSNNYTGGALFLISDGSDTRGSSYQIVYNPNTSKILQLSSINLDIDSDSDVAVVSDFDFDVVLRYYNFSEPLVKYAQIASASTAKNQIIISDSNGVPEVGDRIEIIERTLSTESDVACAPRNITAVSGPTDNKYTVTLDEDLPAQINATLAAENAWVIFGPLLKAKKISVNGDIDFKDFRIPIPSSPKFKKLLIEVEFRPTKGSPRLNSIEIQSNIWQE
ncbi:MAG: hypothetical protein ACTSPI_06720 [Candidatus Heimdallarchaeaceae archaeon]